MLQVPQIEIEEQLVEVPVAKHVQVQMIQKVQKMVDAPQVEYEDQATPEGLKPGLWAQVDGRVQRLDGTSLDFLGSCFH